MNNEPKTNVIEGFGLGDIGGIFNKIGDAFGEIAKLGEKIGDAFKQITHIQEILMCPVNILQNLPTCSYYYLEDVIIIILAVIVYWICFIFLFIPIFIAFSIIKIPFKIRDLVYIYRNPLWGNYDYVLNRLNISPDDVCPTKDDVSFFVEFVYRKVISESNLINRSGSDLGNCYCLEPIRDLFQPYSGYSDPEETLLKATMPGFYVFVSFIIFAILCVLNHFYA